MSSITGILEFVSGETQIIVNPESFTVESIGGEFQLSINCATSWKFLNVPSYIAVSKVRGYGDDIIDVTFSANSSVTEDRVGSFTIQNTVGDQATISFTQKKAVIDWKYTFNVPSFIDLKNVGETTSLAVTSYKTPYVHGSVYGDNVNVDYTLSSNVTWCTCSGNSITATENPNTSSRVGVISYTQAESSKTASTSITQAASVWTWKYNLSVSKNSWNSTAAPTSTDVEISAYRQKHLNGRVVDEMATVDTTIVNNAGFITVTETAGGATFASSNNTSTSAKSGNLVITPTLDDTTTYPIEGTNPSVTFSVTQDAGVKVYSAVTASLSYSEKAAAAGGTCSPIINYSQTYTWNGVSGSGGNVNTSDISVGNYSLSSTTGASVNISSGVVTWDNNQSLSERTSGDISVTITGLGGKANTVSAICKQNAGYYTYSDIAFSTLTYGTVNSGGGSSSPSIKYTQTYGWNGAISGIGTITGGSNDDDYTTYSVASTTGLSLNTSTGVATWEVNKGTSGVEDSTTRSATVTASVTRNGKTATKTATTSQTGEKEEGPSNISYGAWTFSITPSVTSIAATGGSSTITLTRPTRSVTKTYLSGDTVTYNETATSGTFSFSRSNTTFTLSATSGSLTSSSVPSVTLNVGATGAAAVSAISSTVTASFTASSPTTGTTTASKTTGNITRSASSQTGTEYQFSTFSVGSTSFTAAGGTTTLSMVVQERSVYTGDQKTGWSTFRPVDGRITVNCSDYCQASAITYDNTSTCTITVLPNYNTSSSRTMTVSAQYTSTSWKSSTITISQSKDATTTITYGTPSISFSYGTKNAAAGTINPSGSWSQSRIQNYVSGNTSTLSAVTGTIDDSYTTYAVNTSNSAATLNTTTGAVQWQSNTSSSSRSCQITATVTVNGKSGSATATCTQSADAISSTSYGNVTKGAISNTTIPASGTTSNYTATAGNGSQVLTYSWVSGKTNTSETKTISPSHSSISATASSKGTTVSDVTVVKSQAVTWSGYGSKSASDTMYIYQQANVRSLASVYIVPYQPDSSWIVTVSNGNWNTCPASGGYVKCYGYANYSHTSGSPLNDQYITSDAKLSWSTGYNSWITDHSNGGYYIANRCTTDGDARSATGTWTYDGKTSSGKTLTQQSNYASVSSYGGWKAVGSWSGWSDYDYPYADTTGNYWASCSIGSGISAGGGSATVSKSAGHTVYHYKRQRRSGTQYRDINYVWTSGCTWTHENGSSQTAYDYQQVSNGSSSASDSCTIAIVSNGNSRFSLSGTTLSHSSMGTNIGTDSVTVRCTNSASGSTGDASTSVSNYVSSIDYWSTTSNGYPMIFGNDVPAGGGWVSPSFTGDLICTFYFVSGSNTNTTPSSTYGTLSTSQSWGWDPKSLSGADINTTNGSFYAPSLGKTIKDRTKLGNIVRYISATWTPKSGYNWGGTKTDSGTVTSASYPCQQANSVGSWYDNGSWGGWSDTGSPYYVGSEWEGSSTDYWASCYIGSGITAAGGSAPIGASAGHTRNFYKSRNIATIRYMPTRRNYTSGEYDTSSRSETSARAYDSPWQRNAAAADTANLSEIVDNNGRFSISGTTLLHGSMGTSSTTDNCTVRCTNGSNSSAIKDASVSVSNSVSGITWTLSASNQSATASGNTYAASVSSLRNDRYTSGYSSGDYNAPYYLSSNASWATVSGTSVVVSKNSGSSSRTATITVTQYNGGKSTTYKITQDAAIVQSDLYINVTTYIDSNTNEIYCQTSTPVQSNLWIYVYLKGEFMYGGGSTDSNDCAVIYMPKGSREASTIVKVPDLFEEPINIDTVQISQGSYVEPSSDSYYRYHLIW